MISMKTIWDWAGTNPAQRKFIEGERVYQAGHIIKCGKNELQQGSGMSFTAICLQTSNLRDSPHEIKGDVSTSGEIISCYCSCKAGLGEKCKHIIAALLYCYQKGDSLETLSCTDKKCEWKKEHKTALENYNPAPLLQHSCFAQPLRKKKLLNAESIKECQNEVVEEESEEEPVQTEESQPTQQSSKNASNSTKIQKKRKSLSDQIEVTESQLDEIKTLICSKLPESALAKHVIGRHDPIVPKEKSMITEAEKITMKAIFDNQYNELMETISNLNVDGTNDCCLRTLNQLSANLQDLCEKTKNTYAHWMRERHSRITGSICYGLYTYTKSNRSDDEWLKKFTSCYAPKDFKSDILEHGRVTEEEARNAFRKIINSEIVEVGLVISKLNPWLGYSPDGVLMRNNKPVALLEIKCPIVGKTENINATVNSQMNKCLVQSGENIILKEKHQYYGQVQMGMAVLNLNLTYFIYSSFDKQIFCLRVQRNNVFIAQMLMAVKKVYFKFKLHTVCLERGNSVEIEADKVV